MKTLYLAAAAALLLSVAPASADGFTCALGLQPVSNCAGAGDSFSYGGRGLTFTKTTVDEDGNVISVEVTPVDGGYRGPHSATVTRHGGDSGDVSSKSKGGGSSN